MAVTINSASTPTLAQFQADMLKVVEILNRGTYPAQIIAPGSITHLKNISNAALTTSIVST